MMQSGRVALATSGRISGSGLAKAKTIGLSAMLLSISGVSKPGAEQPRNMSASLTASSRVRSDVSRAKAALLGSISGSRPAQITPLESTTVIFSLGMPMLTKSFKQAMAAAPAPEQTKVRSEERRVGKEGKAEMRRCTYDKGG